MTGYKTFFVATLITLFGFLEQSNIVDLIPESYKGVAIAAIGLIMAVLRFMTKTPVFKSEP